MSYTYRDMYGQSHILMLATEPASTGRIGEAIILFQLFFIMMAIFVIFIFIMVLRRFIKRRTAEKPPPPKVDLPDPWRASADRIDS